MGRIEAGIDSLWSRGAALTSLVAVAASLIGCQQASPISIPPTQAAAPAAATQNAVQAPHAFKQLTPEQAQALQASLTLPADAAAKLEQISKSVDGHPERLSAQAREDVKRTLMSAPASTGARFFGLSGTGEFAGENGITKLGNNRYMFSVPAGRVLVVTQVQDPHMLSINGFTLADSPNSFDLTVTSNSSAKTQCQNQNSWWWWGYSDGCGGGGGYWGWWWWGKHESSSSNSSSNTGTAEANNQQSLYQANYLFGSDEPVVFGSVVMTSWRVSGYTVPESYIGGMSLAK